MHKRIYMKKLIMIAIASCVICITTRANDEIVGNVISVIDGNTLEIAGNDNQVYKVLLAGIDCPEIGQEYGDQAKKFLERLVLRKDVTVRFQGKDRRGNHLAIVMIKGNKDLRVDILKEGLAWTSEKDPSPDLEEYKTSARQKGKGLWKEDNPVPPWTYRREQSMLQPKSS
jgi:micrococcal nuclease